MSLLLPKRMARKLSLIDPNLFGFQRKTNPFVFAGHKAKTCDMGSGKWMFEAYDLRQSPAIKCG